jgi:WD40 repeat protein
MRAAAPGFHVIAATGITLSFNACIAQTWEPEILRVYTDDGQSGEWLGESVALYGNRLLAGTPRYRANGLMSGAVHVFDLTSGALRGRLVASDAMSSASFGDSVAAFGDRSLVGAPRHRDPDYQSGAAYIFDLRTMQERLRLFPTQNDRDDLFGSSVAMSASIAAVGAPDADGFPVASGVVYLFDPATGEQLHVLLPDDGAPGDRFGWSVAIAGHTLIVGSPNHGAYSGAAYLFDTRTGAQLAKLLPNDGDEGDEFGWSVAVSATMAIVGALDDDNGRNSGSAYVFDLRSGEQLHKLQPDVSSSLDVYGASVAILGNTAGVGASSYTFDGRDFDSVFLYDVRSGEQIAWLASSINGGGIFLGCSLALRHDVAVAGAMFDNGTRGAAYVFDVSGRQPCVADIARPFDALTFADLLAFLTSFTAGDPFADLAEPAGQFTFADINAFLAAFAAGCP